MSFDESKLINYISEAILIINEEGYIEYQNDYSKNLFRKFSKKPNIIEIFPGLDLSILSIDEKPFQKLEIELFYKIDNFEVIPFDIEISEIAVKKFVLVLKNISQKKTLEKVHRDFVSNVSHELRSPLTSLIGFLELLINEDNMDEPMRDRFLKIMSEESNRMELLVEDLLLLSRVEIDKGEEVFVSIPIVPLIKSVVNSLSIKLIRKCMSVQIITPDSSNTTKATISGIEDEIHTVFVNLIENAIKYGFDGTQIKIVICCLDGRYSEVKIINEGDLIQEPHIKRLTERFYRIDKSRSRSIGGTGLGLAIVKHILIRHKTTLSIKSTSDEGNIFGIKFFK